MTDHRTPLLPDDWIELEPLVDHLLDAPPEGREAVLSELAAGDPRRRAALVQVMADCDRDLPLLERPALDLFDQLLEEVAGPALPGVVGERYRIEREIGRGGMARVYVAEDLKHARRVAVKVIRPELAASLGRDRFLREIGIATELHHSNIMPLLDSGDVDGLLYFVMPYEAGPSLRARLERDGRLATADAINILRDVARALVYAHEHGIVHRDIKPDNVLLAGDAAVVTDFGIAKALLLAQATAGTRRTTEIGAVIGTPAYMSPEQALGDPAIDHRADIYSFGCLAYEVFAGKPPFSDTGSLAITAAQMGEGAPLVTSSRPDVPSSIADLIARCLRWDPADRPQDAAELVDILGTFPTTDLAPARP
jgi:serine/threonine protein kinase